MPAFRGHFASAIALSVVATFMTCGVAFAQSPEELERARAIFDEALRDQQAGRNDVALEKFRRVAAVRDTTQVEFRVASCLEALGRKREALKAYDLSARLGRGDAQVQDVVDAANDRVGKLAAAMGKVEIDVSGRSADRADVRIDGESITREELRGPIFVEPGSHVLEVSAPEAKPARMTVSVNAGARAPVSVQLAPAVAEPPPAVVVTSTARRNIGIALTGVGFASAIGAGLSFFLRHDTIATIEADCPNDTCPLSRQSEIEGLRTTAIVLGPVAAVCAGLAVAGLGAGIVLIALGPTKHTVPAAWLAPSPLGLQIGGQF